jgi:hypothetical protein
VEDVIRGKDRGVKEVRGSGYRERGRVGGIGWRREKIV